MQQGLDGTYIRFHGKWRLRADVVCLSRFQGVEGDRRVLAQAFENVPGGFIVLMIIALCVLGCWTVGRRIFHVTSTGIIGD